MLSVDLANLPGPKPEVEEGNEGMNEADVSFGTIHLPIAGDISETDEESSTAVKIKKFEK